MKLVSVVILSNNEIRYIKRCINSVLEQTYKNLEIFVIDNGSTDGSQEFINNNFASKLILIENPINIGATGGRNQGIKVSRGDYMFFVDANAFITHTYIEKLLNFAESSNDIGMVQGKIYSIGQEEELQQGNRIIDSTGICITRDRRNFEIGQGEADSGKYDNIEYMFTTSLAASLYKMKMLEDVKIEDEYFDKTFFIYREEIDLGWRAQLLGWKSIYVPTAIGYHTRVYTPSNRKNLSENLRYFQFRNRYLMIIKNDSWKNFTKDVLHILWFEVKAFIYVFIFEPFLLKAYFDVIRLFPQMHKKRRCVMGKKLVSDKYIKSWFKFST